MKAIDPNAVIDAIARHFPDGFERDNDEWPRVLCEALGLDPDNDDAWYGPLCDTIKALRKDGRLRYSQAGYETTALSWEEQARRIVAALGDEMGFTPNATLIDIAANVLAGKTEKKL